jgi:hypothetical protein
MQGIDCFPQIEQDNRLSYENKVNLTAAIGIKRGERINIDNLSLSEEDKQGLRDFQKQCSSPLSFDYTIKCKDCGKEEKSAFI